MRPAHFLRQGASLAALGCALLPGSSHAESIKGKFRFQIDTSVLSAESMKATVTSQPAVPQLSSVGDTGALGGLQPPPLQDTSLALHTLAPGGGVSLGIGVSDGLLLGVRVGLEQTNLGSSFGGLATTYQILPTAEYVFQNDGRAQMFLAGSVGYAHSDASSGNFATSSSDAFLVGPSLGFHGWLTDNLSIDPSVRALYTRGTSSVDDIFLNISSSGVPTRSGHAEFDREGVYVGLSLGFSAWFSTRPRHSEPVNVAVPMAASGPSGEPEPDLDADGGLSITLMLESSTQGNLQVALNAHPLQQPDRVTLTAHGHAQSSQCSDIRLRAFGVSEALENARASKGEANGPLSLEAETTLRVLEGVASDGSRALLMVCGDAWGFDEAARQKVRAFARKLASVSHR